MATTAKNPMATGPKKTPPKKTTTKHSAGEATPQGQPPARSRSGAAGNSGEDKRPDGRAQEQERQ